VVVVEDHIGKSQTHEKKEIDESDKKDEKINDQEKVKGEDDDNILRVSSEAQQDDAGDQP
jgi:hypothetical protein